MNDSDVPEAPDEKALDEGALDDEALEGVSGGTGGVAHELTHTVQQGSGIGANETITVGASRTLSVGTTQKK